MSTHSKVAKTETREMVERDRTRLASRLHEPTDWKQSSYTFAIAVAVIVAALVIGFIALK